MATGAESLQLFNQLVALGNTLFLSDEDFVTINGVTKPTLKKVYAEFLASISTYPTVAEGLTKTNGTGTDNRFFSVPGAGDVFETRYRNDAGVAVEISSLLSWNSNSLTINRGKVYPLRRMTRNSITSAEPIAFSKAILNICIIGARAGKYYRLAYYVNGSSALGPTAKPDGWIVEEIDQANYATAANPVTTVINYTDAGTPAITRDGIQTVVLSSTVVPDLRILITLDTAALPTLGTAIAANSSGQSGYSYIIDPSRYIPAKSDITNSITINAGQIAPFRSVSRGGGVSTPNTLQTLVILNARVINAKPGKYYGLRYFQNGNDAVVPAADGWIVEEVDIVGYDASVITNGTTISALVDPQPTIDRTLGIQTVLINTKTDVRIELVLDASKLQAYGNQYGMNFVPQNGYSQVIDPACYEFPVAGNGTGPRVSYTLDAAGRLTLSWPDGIGTRGFVFGPNGENSLANFAQVIRNGGAISAFGTDWLPPMIFDAVNNGDGWPTLEFTGGNHRVDNKLTAASVAYVIEADGVPLTGPTSGTADRITCRIVNKLMAGNTVSLGRYPLLQSFQVDFMPGVSGVHADIMALEDVDIYTDYACQIVTTGVNDTLFYLGGQFPQPIPFDSTVNSGSPADYPDAWAVLTTSANGQLAAWIDRKYGVAAESQIFENYGKIIGGGGTSTKQYTTAINKERVRNPANAMRLQAGKSYQWRGGYSWGPVSLPDGMVATLRYMDEWRIRRAFAVSASKILKP
ncbi:hypothetical protein MBA34_17900 [Pseudomonas capeferrum]|uniref:hypothetical protein n=1 Tax=Pseudomonas capeferrum TaxID=1495066 RepID=UPI0004DA7033|nr:hypothetical protein [Pseudomonas capeferrum]KEY87839.1 hypothetical protein PC358_01630 [Pseudomonas capeferrum]MCH7300893.1 hypothetical protein [Pseudomonas capeferrum]